MFGSRRIEDVPASPGPRGVPLEGPAAEAVNAGALGAGVGIGLSPEVVVDGVVTGYGAVPLTAVVRTFLDGSGGYGEGERCRAGDEECAELHVEGWW